MYEQHFGLDQNPFQSVAEGEAVFEGPAQAKVVRDLKMALTTRDSIAVLTGPVGVGKTTIVNRALAQLGSSPLVARLGRTQVGSDELVDLLLAQFGIVREPTRRFECLKTFNRILNERAASGSRVCIVIEDAERLGASLLEELEALTASDSGASAGANIVLMGPQKLDKLLTIPVLERLRQRIRLQQALDRLSADEVEDYLRHRIKAAGGDFDAIFEPGTALMVRRCSGGIPRVMNGLCETALTVAAEKQMPRVTARTVFKVAVEVFGMGPSDAPAPAAESGGQAGKAKSAPAAKPVSAAPKPQKATEPEKTAPAARPEAPTAAEPKAPSPDIKMPNAPSKTVPGPKPAEVAAPKESTAKPVADETADPTIPVAKVPAAPAAKARPQEEATSRTPPPATGSTKDKEDGTSEPAPARLPDVSGLGIQDKTAAGSTAPARKPMPDLPPKFKFADEILLDSDSKTKSRAKPARSQEPPTLELEDDAPKVAKEASPVKKVPAPPSPALDDIPTLGDSARVEKLKPKPHAATAEKSAPAGRPPERPIVKTGSPAKATEPQVDEPTASFAKVDHDLLETALANLAVHDEKDNVAPDVEAKASDEKPPTVIPEVTLDRNIESERPARKADNDRAVLDELAAELHKAKSLEDVSDKLAETLFGCEELEAVSLKIRENFLKEHAEAQLAAEADETAPSATPEVEKSPRPADSPGAPRPPAATAPKARPDAPNQNRTPNAPAAPAPKSGSAQPDPIEKQFSSSMTATLRTLNSHGEPSDDGDDEEQSSGGLLGRLKGTLKS